ncbi:MAG: LCP family protein [Firmicutes bacterium]|nr:LCP family protein [Bacillota bacterium]
MGILLLIAAVGLKVYQVHAATLRPLNVLLIGVDRGGARSDVVVLAHWEPRYRVLSLISLPRDLRVEIPCPPDIKGCRSPDKLAHVHAYGEVRGQGPELLTRTVSQYLGVPVRYYVEVDFEGFARIVDALGGVTIDVEKPMVYVDPYQNLRIHLQPGRQRLDGEKALQYVRYRSDGLGDIGRIARTQKFFYAVLESLQENGGMRRLPRLAVELYPYVRTNLDLGTLVALAQAAQDLDRESLRVYTIPGRSRTIDGLSYWIGDPDGTRQVVREAILEVKPPARD